MTGFGRARGPIGDAWSAEVTAKSVNHRFLDLTIRVRESEAALEPAIRQAFAQRLSRGKVEVALRLSRTAPGGPAVVVDERLLESLLERLADLGRKYPIQGEVRLRDLVAIPQLLSVDASGETFSEEEIATAGRIAGEAADAMVRMREAEGGRIAAELAGRIGTLESRLAPLAARRDEIVRAVAANLRERMRTLFAEIPLDSGRLEQEAALAAERSDVAEELARLSGHLAQFRALLAGGDGPVGKKLDFLSQEVLREVNTLGSKARDLTLLRDVLDMKAETEKIREQVQNVE